MIKKGLIVLGVICVIGLVGYLALGQKSETTNRGDIASSKTVSEVENSSEREEKKLPSFEELSKKYGSEVTDLGEYRIITAFYKENPHVQLEDEQGEEMELTISSIQEKDEVFTFIINDLESVEERKTLGDRIKLAKKEGKYLEYQ